MQPDLDKVGKPLHFFSFFYGLSRAIALGGRCRWYGLGQNEPFYDLGIVGMLECQYLLSYALRCVGGEQCHFGLKDDMAFVIFFIDLVDGHPGFLFIIVIDGLMDMLAVHALTSVSGQEGRVDVDYGLRKSLYQEGGDELQKACQHYEVYFVFVQKWEKGFLISEDTPRNHLRCYAMLAGPF